MSTDIPMSDSARAGESLIPSPKNPTIWLFRLRPIEDLKSAQSKLAIVKNLESLGVLKKIIIILLTSNYLCFLKRYQFSKYGTIFC